MLDACAAPGGKTCHVLEIADVELTAIDSDAMRLQRVQENLDRLALRAQLRCADASRPEGWWDGRLFDRILCDAPCSSSGVVRRHPDSKWLRREADIATYVERQAQLLDGLWQVLATGGKLLYATCSLFEEENGNQVRRFMARHPDARRLPIELPQATDGQLIPDSEHDGFFYALLAKA